jgi:hypothetical protein
MELAQEGRELLKGSSGVTDREGVESVGARPSAGAWGSAFEGHAFRRAPVTFPVRPGFSPRAGAGGWALRWPPFRSTTLARSSRSRGCSTRRRRAGEVLDMAAYGSAHPAVPFFTLAASFFSSRSR